MAPVQVNARDWTFLIRDPAVQDPASASYWVEIGGITSMEISPDAEDVDTTTFASKGAAEHQIMQRSLEITLEGRYLEDATGKRDKGQELVEKLADQLGEASLGQLRVVRPSGRKRDHIVSAKLGEVSGENNDKTAWSVTLTRSGASVEVA
ncbi:phage tail tube protein [Spirillospora sp. NPDC048911]|uniref:phage tail tube protein n=1 Tax=Spirillospora sp. NPDC048911 TaxID=3364527 RepID=UPI00372252BA